MKCSIISPEHYVQIGFSLTAGMHVFSFQLPACFISQQISAGQREKSLLSLHLFVPTCQKKDQVFIQKIWSCFSTRDANLAIYYLSFRVLSGNSFWCIHCEQSGFLSLLFKAFGAHCLSEVGSWVDPCPHPTWHVWETSQPLIVSIKYQQP